ncbi:c-type cytochrome [Chryseobacterium culicis]|uniref:Cytochrome C n=1 Tax=Chryseobacterium culicis TaxID=680127 RepID=A0A2S9CP87_CHRCI|nr:c-type cytochrome [Chryseobacterium culicis]PRB82313.1 cytochrome C [Chryseobacterium culicis]PRB88688.1 cytochrome C [Chryseobacterium culicis]
MKAQFLNIAIILSLSLTALSCSKSETTPIPKAEPYSAEQVIQPQPAAPVPTPSPSPDASKHEGLQLIEGTDCLTCHKIDSKLIGPSYQEVAAKYTETDLDMLAQKIIDGGKGNWGEIPMTPHTGLSKENARQMVKYILSLKK